MSDDHVTRDRRVTVEETIEVEEELEDTEETVEERQARVAGAKEPGRTPNDVVEEIAKYTYGDDWLAAEVQWLEIDEENGELQFEVDIPGHGTHVIGPWSIDTWDDDDYFVRILRDHGLTKYDPEGLVGRRVLVKMDGNGNLDLVYNPKHSGHDYGEWHEERLGSPYADTGTTKQTSKENRYFGGFVLSSLAWILLLAAIGGGTVAFSIPIAAVMIGLFGLGSVFLGLAMNAGSD